MAEFERGIAHYISQVLTHRRIHGSAWRLKLSRFNTPCIDAFHRLHTDRDTVHPIDAISAFIRKTGRWNLPVVKFQFDAGLPGECPGQVRNGLRPCCASEPSGVEYDLPGPDTNILSHRQLMEKYDGSI